MPSRNLEMVERIEAVPVRYPLRFAFAGDSGAWSDPTADAIYAELVRQVGVRAPLFFANLGDFAGPGTRARHEHYEPHANWGFGRYEREFVAICAGIG